MRGTNEHGGSLFSYGDLEARIPGGHPLRLIRSLVEEALLVLSPDFERLYSKTGQPSIAPEKLLRALLLQAFYTIRSERQLMEQLDYNLCGGERAAMMYTRIGIAKLNVVDPRLGSPTWVWVWCGKRKLLK